MKQTKAERNLSQQGYRQSSLGRMAAKRAAIKLSDKRRLVAATRPEKIARPRVYDAKAVQQTLTMWGG